MAKVNLLTIHYGKCYGAVMQTYATCKMLEDAGHSVCVINLISPVQKGSWRTIQYWKDCIREFQFWLLKKSISLNLLIRLIQYEISYFQMPMLQ